jgi:hypothetical protein
MYFYGELRTLQKSRGNTLKELIEVGALNPSHGWSHAFQEEIKTLERAFGLPE